LLCAPVVSRGRLTLSLVRDRTQAGLDGDGDDDDDGDEGGEYEEEDANPNEADPPEEEEDAEELADNMAAMNLNQPPAGAGFVMAKSVEPVFVQSYYTENIKFYSCEWQVPVAAPMQFTGCLTNNGRNLQVKLHYDQYYANRNRLENNREVTRDESRNTSFQEAVIAMRQFFARVFGKERPFKKWDIPLPEQCNNTFVVTVNLANQARNDTGFMVRTYPHSNEHAYFAPGHQQHNYTVKVTLRATKQSIDETRAHGMYASPGVVPPDDFP